MTTAAGRRNINVAMTTVSDPPTSTNFVLSSRTDCKISTRIGARPVSRTCSAALGGDTAAADSRSRSTDRRELRRSATFSIASLRDDERRLRVGGEQLSADQRMRERRGRRRFAGFVRSAGSPVVRRPATAERLRRHDARDNIANARGTCRWGNVCTSARLCTAAMPGTAATSAINRSQARRRCSGGTNRRPRPAARNRRRRPRTAGTLLRAEQSRRRASET